VLGHPMLLMIMVFSGQLQSTRGPCRTSLDFVITKAETNYSGFHDKVTANNQSAYLSHTMAARAAADSARDDEGCFVVLNDWLHFFHDGHIAVRWAPSVQAPGGNMHTSAVVPPTIQRLSDHTLLLTLPRFNNEQAPLITDLFQRHSQDLAQADNLIVDVRMNGGGSDFVWMPVMHFLYTRPVIAIGSSILSTPDNIAKFENIMADATMPDSDKRDIPPLIDQLRSHPGQLVHRSDDTISFAGVLPRPRRVAVVTASGCQSSCEGFVLAARQSGKTCILGEHTGGVLDYANQWHLAIPDSKFAFWYPTSRSQRLPDDPVDVVGISPDIRTPVPDVTAVAALRALIERGTGWPCKSRERK
jgi:hypothetical protein